MAMTTLIFLLTFLFKFVGTVQIGNIKYASVITNTSLISTSRSDCSDCLCDCLADQNQINSTISTCHGINCFPSNQLCQRIEQLWIQDTDISFNNTLDQFISTIDINFCSCYSSQNILNKYENVTSLSIAHLKTRYIIYNVYDDTLIVLGDNLIGQYFVSNLTRFRNFSVTDIPLAVCIDSLNIYISFYSNMSVNKYDMQMKFIQSIRRPITTSSTGLYGLARWKNQLFVSDDRLSLIWSMNLTTMNMSIYLNLSSRNILPFNIAVFKNHLYVSQIGLSIIYNFDLASGSLQNITFPNSIGLYRLQMDPFCNRLWFGTNQTIYSSVPVLNLNTNTAYLYQAKGSLAGTTAHIVAFDSNYSMYTITTNGNSFTKYRMSAVTCGTD